MDPKLGLPQDGLSFSLCSIFHPCIPFKQEQFWVKNVEGGLVTQSLHWSPVYLLEVVSSGSISPLLVISSKVIPFLSTKFC